MKKLYLSAFFVYMGKTPSRNKEMANWMDGRMKGWKEGEELHISKGKVRTKWILVSEE